MTHTRPSSFLSSLRTAIAALACGLMLLLSPDARAQITLPAPIAGAFQDFEAVNEGELPAGWSVQNFTGELNLDPNLDDPLSASYEDWVVISRDRVNAVDALGGWEGARRLNVAPGQSVNGAPITELMIGKFIYAESDQRGGSQVQYLFSPDFNCTGQVGVTLVFYSGYEQNQDSLGATEYSVDEGVSWLPIAYFIDGPDIVRDQDQNIDAEATMNNSHGDVATYTDEFGETIGMTFGSFIAAPITPDLAPFIQGRVDNNATESKRVEVYRLPQADNKPKVRLRFAQAGTASWYWGLDNIGLYAIAPRQAPARPTLTAPAAAPFFSTSVALTGSAFSAADAAQTHGLSVWQVAVEGAFSPDTGFASPALQISSSTDLTSLALPLEYFFPGQSVQVSVRYQDGFGNKSQFAAPQTIAIATEFPSLVPGTFEDFESTPEFEVPPGWELENQSEEGFLYRDWTVVSEGTLSGFGGQRVNKPEVFTGNSLYGQSDSQVGNAIQFITTPPYNLSGYAQVWVAYKSNYIQNQDSLAGLEFTTDNGASWQPVVYMIDQSDIIRLPNGTPDPVATLTTTYGDLAKIFLEDGVTRVDAGKYEDFIRARPLDPLGPFISGRADDGAFESKRYQRYRVAGLDNQAQVRFRFAHAGDDSWFWGIDDFGLYSFSPPAPASDVVITSVKYTAAPASFELKWTSVAARTYTVQTSLNLVTWSDLAVDVVAPGPETTYTHTPLPAGELARYYRVR